jgi:hypothetical protein
MVRRILTQSGVLFPPFFSPFLLAARGRSRSRETPPTAPPPTMDEDGSNAAAYSLLELNSGRQKTLHPQQQHTINSSSSSSSVSSASQEHQRLRQYFENQAGIRLSSCWLEQCLLHICSGSNRIDDVEEEIWNQILHADLRDVVREPPCHSSEGNNDDNSAGAAEKTAAGQLRHAIHQSSINSTATSNGKFQSSKVSLPSNFRLLVQIEEIVDVTMSGEQLLAAMGDNSVTETNTYNNSRQQQQRNNGNTSHNLKYRCLKMVVSDGCHSNGGSLAETNLLADDGKENHDQIMFARETSPILNLSLSSPPGVKLVLQGPLDVRCGILELNDGNCLVAGGEIDSWKLIRSKAKEKAQRERGLGVDPTIKALIWNPIMGDEDGMYSFMNESIFPTKSLRRSHHKQHQKRLTREKAKVGMFQWRRQWKRRCRHHRHWHSHHLSHQHNQSSHPISSPPHILTL